MAQLWEWQVSLPITIVIISYLIQNWAKSDKRLENITNLRMLDFIKSKRFINFHIGWAIWIVVIGILCIWAQSISPLFTEANGVAQIQALSTFILGADMGIIKTIQMERR